MRRFGGQRRPRLEKSQQIDLGSGKYAGSQTVFSQGSLAITNGASVIASAIYAGDGDDEGNASLTVGGNNAKSYHRGYFKAVSPCDHHH